jgi:hypothetical protein
MPSPLSQAGATVEPSEYSTLAMDEQFTGLWTQRCPLRDADVPYLYRKYYSASRFDSIIDGINREISAKLTDARRPGSSVFNSNTFPAGYSFYPFRWVQNQQEIIRLLYDGQDGTIYDATAGQKSSLFTKSSHSARARFVAVGATLYVGDGAQTKKVVRSPQAWAANSSFSTDQFIVDTNNNLQLASGVQTATIAQIKVEAYTLSGGGSGKLVTLFLDPSTPITVQDNVALTLSGLTTVPTLNGTTPYTTIVLSSVQVQIAGVFFGVPVTGLSAETGTASTGSGITAGSQPTWSSTLGLVTQDGGQQWVCRGSSVQNWGGAAPAAAPTVTQAAAATIYASWAANTWYAASFVIVDSNTNLQQLTTAGITGGGAPAWAIVAGNTTADGTAVWTCKGSGAWVASATHAAGDLVVATFTYYTTTSVWEASVQRYVTFTVSNTVTAVFTCTTAGISGANAPGWSNGLGTTTVDGSVTWTNTGTPPAWPGATQTLSLATTIVDSLGNIEQVQNLGKSGGSAPTWHTTNGALTIDNTLSWLNTGPYSAANTGQWYWAYSGLNSITGEITNPSPTSQPLLLAVNNQAVIQGSGLADTQFDSIILWRTAQNGVTLLYNDQFANPGAGASWIFTDTTPDNLLNAFQAAPGSALTSALCTPPPATATAPEYHAGRIFMVDGSFVRWSGGPDTTVGNGNSAMPSLNNFELPEQPIRLKSITLQGGGLLVMCVANTYIILGNGTSSDPFLPPRMFMEGVGIVSYDAFCMRGSTIYGFSNRSKVFSFDPGNGEIEVGYPLGDQFQLVTTGGISSALYNPATAYVTWHEKFSGDTALYVADGAVGWFRWSPVSPPESGSLWSPRAAIVNGTSAVQSVETSPGTFNLLIAPAVSGAIRQRDTTQTGDWNGSTYQAFPSWDVKGSIALCDTGEIAEIAHIALKSAAVGARPIVSLLLDELQAGVTVEGRTSAWDVLSLDPGRHEDPPNLAPSITMYSDRYKTSSTAMTPKCENFQLKVDYGSQLFPDELLKFAVYGATFKERKQQ